MIPDELADARRRQRIVNDTTVSLTFWDRVRVLFGAAIHVRSEFALHRRRNEIEYKMTWAWVERGGTVVAMEEATGPPPTTELRMDESEPS